VFAIIFLSAHQLNFMNEDIYKRPPISFSDRLRELSSLNIEDRITNSLLSATNSKNVTELLVGVMYGTNFQDRLKDVKVEARGSQILELADAVDNIQWYGKFRGPALACQLQYLFHKGYLAEARFGREHSPVIYLKPPHWNRLTYDSPTKVEVVKSLRRLHPDHMDESEAYGIRAMWD
jgi:hypothetical protein